MWGRQLGMAVAVALVMAGGLGQAERSLCKMVSADSRVLYLWAEYKMLRGDHRSAVDLLQMASARKNQQMSEKSSQQMQRSHRSNPCTAIEAQPIPMMF